MASGSRDDNECAIREQATFAYNHTYQRPPAPRDEVEAEFLQRARLLLEGLMSGDSSHPALKMISKDFKARHDRFSTTASMSISEFLKFVSQLKTNDYFIDTHLEIVEEWVDFDGTERMPHATVWRSIEHRRHTEGLVGNGMRIQKWRKAPAASSNDWECYYAGVLISAPFMSGKASHVF